MPPTTALLAECGPAAGGVAPRFGAVEYVRICVIGSSFFSRERFLMANEERLYFARIWVVGVSFFVWRDVAVFGCALICGAQSAIARIAAIRCVVNFIMSFLLICTLTRRTRRVFLICLFLVSLDTEHGATVFVVVTYCMSCTCVKSFDPL